MLAFGDLHLGRIQFNGGVYLLHFSDKSGKNEVFKKIAEHNLSVNYIRDITHSSRRFFVQ
jgi:ABC-2 type transport system ATP-binding protein